MYSEGGANYNKILENLLNEEVQKATSNDKTESNH